MTNLLSETIRVISDNGKTTRDVLWVGDKLASISWREFAVQAAQIDYDDGYGLEEINLALVVVGKDWWLERHEYDGSEWWEFKSLPTMPPKGTVKITQRYLGN